MSCSNPTPTLCAAEYDLRAEIRVYNQAGAEGRHVASLRVFLGALELPTEPVEVPQADAERLAWLVCEALRVIMRNETGHRPDNCDDHVETAHPEHKS